MCQADAACVHVVCQPEVPVIAIILWPWPLIEVNPLVADRLIVFAGSCLMTALVPTENLADDIDGASPESRYWSHTLSVIPLAPSR